MSLSIDDLQEIGLPVSNANGYTLLMASSAFDWLQTNTSLVFNIDDIATLKDLPPTVKLFVMKFIDIMRMGTGVTSESIGSLNHSFDTSSKSALIWQYAEELLGGYLRSQVSVRPATKRWC